MFDRNKLRILYALEVSLLIHEHPSPVGKICDGTRGQEARQLAAVLPFAQRPPTEGEFTCQQLLHKTLPEV
jgi:hypothetical protein